MASRTSPKRPAPTRKPDTKKSAAPAKAKSRTVTTWPKRAAKSVHASLGQHATEVYGITIATLGGVAGLGLYVNAAGAVGSFLAASLQSLFGLYGYLFPPLMVWSGIRLAVGPDNPPVGRTVTGGSLIAAALLGAWHLIAGAPAFGDGIAQLWKAAGLTGLVIAAPLAAMLSTWGAALVLLSTLAMGLLVYTGTPAREVRYRVADWVGQKRATTADAVTKTSVKSTVDTAASDAEDVPPPPRPAVASTEEDKPARKKRKSKSNDPVDPSIPATRFTDYELPGLEVLDEGRRVTSKNVDGVIKNQVAALQDTFEDFGVGAHVARWTRGATVTRFEVELEQGTPVKKVTSLSDDLAYTLAAADIRIVAPIPGKSAIGIEVPNKKRDMVTLGDILRSEEAAKDPHPMTVAIGTDISGDSYLANLTAMPHLLVAGATGSGKSVTVNGMVGSILARAKPDQVRLILIDPKRVELTVYNGAPHLLTPVITDPKRAVDAFNWTVKEMERRYELLAQLGFRNIDGYNQAVSENQLPDPLEAGPHNDWIRGAITEQEDGTYTWKPMPFILLVADELADLMMVAEREIEEAICRIAQMARAVGIHMVLATQRPSVDVVTGLIRANIPARLSLSVATTTDSRVILDQSGAEKLVGNGDLLFLPPDKNKPVRLQGCFVSEKELAQIVRSCAGQAETNYLDGVVKQGKAAQQADLALRVGTDLDEEDELVRAAAELVVEQNLGSTSMLQRKLRVGFARAGRIMDELEALSIVGPSQGSKAREVLITSEQLQEMFAVTVD